MIKLLASAVFFCLFVVFTANATEITQTIYEDGTDSGNWVVYDDTPVGATVKMIYDDLKQDSVIELSGAGDTNGYKLTANNNLNWNNTEQFNIQWQLRFNEYFTVYVSVDTSEGHRYLVYSPVDSDLLEISAGNYHYGLGITARDDTWHTFTRDLKADLKAVEPNNDIVDVNAFLIRGSGRVDDIKLASQLDLPANQIAAGDYFTCAINSEDNAVCWGRNNHGVIDVPTNMGKVYQIFGGGIRNQHICALAENGAFCWGSDGSGQLAVPASLIDITQFTTGQSHTCAVELAGNTTCWGNDSSGQLRVPSDLQTATFISAGVGNTCVLTEFGSRCWGWGHWGQSSVPSYLKNISYIDAGYHHSCAVGDVGVRCFGDNSYGQLDVPAGLNNIKQVAITERTSCALSDEGVTCWGYNAHNLLAVPSLGNVTEIVAGAYHVCALDDAGVHCWGYNAQGQTDVPSGL